MFGLPPAGCITSTTWMGRPTCRRRRRRRPRSPARSSRSWSHGVGRPLLLGRERRPCSARTARCPPRASSVGIAVKLTFCSRPDHHLGATGSETSASSSTGGRVARHRRPERRRYAQARGQHDRDRQRAVLAPSPAPPRESAAPPAASSPFVVTTWRPPWRRAPATIRLGVGRAVLVHDARPRPCCVGIALVAEDQSRRSRRR